ncbi:MAG: alpha-amylase family protein [Tannerella sp.]|jgi:glycosidase|nr:alpha-amylase family protein [Tannerella sp.]
MKTNKHIIYQTFPRLFGNGNRNLVRHGSMEQNGCGKFNSYTIEALDAIRDLGVTHVWYTGVIAHSTCTDYSAFGRPKDHSAIVKGRAGSPYAISDYYDVAPDLAEVVPNRMAEFEALVERTHRAGMKVVIDFVPNHVSRNYRSLKKPAYIDDLGQHDNTNVEFARDNNFYYLPGRTLELHCDKHEEYFPYGEFPTRATGNNCFSDHPSRDDWYETVKLNYGIDYQGGGGRHFTPVPDTWKKMLDILLYWTTRDIDGFRCDMAEMVPIEFWNWAIPRVKNRKNVLFIAEIYTPSLYSDFIRTGYFDYLYDKVGMYDALRGIITRNKPASDIIARWQAIEGIKDNMLFFLENHDEQRIASDYFAGCAQAGIPGMALIALLNTNPVMIYNGQELGERGMDEEGFSGLDGRTSIFDYWSMDSLRRWANGGKFDGGLLTADELSLRSSYSAILNLARSERAFALGKFYGLGYCNVDNPYFPSAFCSAFFRKYDDELIMMLINFDSAEHTVRVNVPKEAFEALHIPDNAVSRVRDILSGDENTCALTYTCPYQATLAPYSAQALKFISIKN